MDRGSYSEEPVKSLQDDSDRPHPLSLEGRFPPLPALGETPGPREGAPPGRRSRAARPAPRRAAPRGGDQRGVWGAEPPTRLETPKGKGSGAPPLSRSEGSNGSPRGGEAGGARRDHRPRLGRPVLAGGDPWRDRVAAHLREHGWEGLARNFGACGRVAIARECAEGCGDVAGHVDVLVSCHARGCPWCDREAAAKQSARLADTWARLPGYLAARRPGLLEELERESAEAEAARDVWLARADKRRKDSAKRRKASLRERDLEGAARHDARARAAELQRSRAERDRYALGQTRWTPRMVTISPRWEKRPEELEPGALRDRARDVLRRWERCWRELLGVHGAAGAHVAVELSERGHVHLHALYFGPWCNVELLARLAGCFVKVRELRVRPDSEPGEALREAAREAAKYSVKGLGPLSHAWMAGEARRAPHPELVSHWIVGTRSMQLQRVYGLARDAWKASEAAEPLQEPEPCRCASCGADLTLAPRRMVKVRELARELGPGGWSLRPVRAPNGRELLPARITPHAIQGPEAPRESGEGSRPGDVV